MDYSIFKVTSEHLKLLPRFNIVWEDSEYGAPAVDCKRPYGNSNVEDDILEILGIIPEDVSNYGDYYTDKQREYAKILHTEMRIVLEILCHNLAINIGWYEFKNLKWQKEI